MGSNSLPIALLAGALWVGAVGALSARAQNETGDGAAAGDQGAALYAAHCASCHGAELKGDPAHGTPDLTDDKWLYTGDDEDNFVMHATDVEKTIRFGIRSNLPETRNATTMPARGATGDLTDAEIELVADYTRSLAGAAMPADRAAAGKALFIGKGVCVDCHAQDAKGDGSIGAPDLTRPSTWAFGADRAALVASIRDGRAGACPDFAGKLSDAQIKAIGAFVFKAAASDAF